VMKKENFVAFDCGNSSIRVVTGLYNGETIALKQLHQVPNETVNVNQIHYWDILHIYKELQYGLQESFVRYGPVSSVGICSWGIDFGLLGESGQLLGNPLCYRNSFGEAVLEKMTEEEKYRIFNATGIPDHPMNSLYQLLGIKKYLPEYYAAARKLLFIPDLLAWLFTGEVCSESTIASTTQMLDMRNNTYATEIIRRYGLDISLFPPLTAHGQCFGNLRKDIADTLKMTVCPFVSVASHDTASAVVAVPAEEDDFLFISSGTWSLIGTERKEPLINRDVYEEGFANEGGAFGTITLLKNSTGMFILQEIKKELEKGGRAYSWDEITRMAGGCEAKIPVFNPNDARFFSPRSMISAICEFFRKDLTIKEVLASAYLSLACSYRHTIEKIEKLCRKTYPAIHIVGGGCRNHYLNQIIADLTEKTVISGPQEATSLGNIGIQLKVSQPDMGLLQIRKILRESISVKYIRPTDELAKRNTLNSYYDNYRALFN